jgi:sugar phosphate isomerase/epimerase
MHRRQADRSSVDRRGFLGALAALLAGGWDGAGRHLGLSALPAPEKPARPPPLGIQLYTLRNLLETDFAGTIAALARIGYGEVEFAGLYGQNARDVRTLLDRQGLKAPAGHYGIPAVTDTLAQTVAEAQTLGHRYVVVPWLPEELRNPDGYLRTADTFNRAGEKLRQAGMLLGYHNHWFEFEPLSGGRCGYDVLLEHTDPRLVTMELDLFWIRKGGGDALEYFASHRGRFRLIHIKDMAGDGTMVDVGQGDIAWPELLRAAERAGVRHRFVEHDEANDPLGFARSSFRYLERLRRGEGG